MKVHELAELLAKLPDDAEILAAGTDDTKFDPITGVERLLLTSLRGAGGKVIAGIIRFDCRHP